MAVSQPLSEVYCCRELYLGSNEPGLLDDAAGNCGATIQPVTEDVFRKISYRDRPDGLIAVAPRPEWGLQTSRRSRIWRLGPVPDSTIDRKNRANLGTILRTADAAGVDGVVVVDQCTDLYNPNVGPVPVSGTLFHGFRWPKRTQWTRLSSGSSNVAFDFSLHLRMQRRTTTRRICRGRWRSSSAVKQYGLVGTLVGEHRRTDFDSDGGSGRFSQRGDFYRHRVVRSSASASQWLIDQSISAAVKTGSS